MNRIALALITLLTAPAAVGQEPESMPGNESQPVTVVELQALVAVCNSCHGPDGVSGQDEIPSLAGIQAEKLVEELEKFYFYERHCPSVEPGYGDGTTSYRHMCEVSGRINKQQAIALGRYYQQQPETAGTDSGEQDSTP